MNVIDLISPSLPALLDTIDGRTTVPRELTLHTAARTIDEVEPGFLTRFLSTADRPEHRQPALPRRHRGNRLRALPPGRRHPRRVRCDLHGVRALRLLGAAALLGGPDARAARRALLVVDAHVTSHGALTLVGARRDRGRADHALPQRPAPYHTSRPADRDRDACCSAASGRSRWRRRWRSGAAPCESARRRSSGWKASCGPAATCSCSGELWRAPGTGDVAARASAVRSTRSTA